MDSTGGHTAILNMQNQVARKEWRAVTEGSGRDRLPGDAPGDHGRANGSVRIRSNAGFHHDNSRNGRIFHSGGSGSSSDSDHHSGDLKHVTGSPQSVAQVADTKIYEEIQRQHHQPEHLDSTLNGHLDSTSNGLSLDFGILSSAKNSNETLEQRLHDVIHQREELQRVEAELRAQYIVLRVQSNFEEQMKQQATIVSNLQEELQERDHRIHELEQQLDEREQQLHANQREANEAVNQVWAKDGLLREQTNELTTLRRECDNILAEQKAAVAQFEAERAQFLSQLQDLGEQLREKERQLQDVDEQRRNAQDSLIYKDEQLREAQTWIQRAQELDAYHASANNTLHAELRDRTDQINQLWLGHQRQLADVERFHAQTIQRLRLEMAEMREQNRLLKGTNSADKNETKLEQSTHSGLKEVAHSNVTDQPVRAAGKGVSATHSQVDHAPGVPVQASPLLGTAPVLPASALPVMHQFPGQLQGMANSVPAAPSQIPQSGLNQFSSSVIVPTQQLPVMHPQSLQPDSKPMQQPQNSQLQRFPHPQQLHIYSHFPEAKSPIVVGARSMNPQQPLLPQQQQQQQQQADREPGLVDQNVPGRKSHVDFSQPSDHPTSVQHAIIQSPLHQLQTGRHIMQADSAKMSEQQLGHTHEEHGNDESHEPYAQSASQQETNQQQQNQQVQLQQQPHQEVDASEYHEQISQAEHQSIETSAKNEQIKALHSLPQQSSLHHMQQLNGGDTLVQPVHHQLSVSGSEDLQIPGLQSSSSQYIANLDLNPKHGSSSQGTQNITSTTLQHTSSFDSSTKAAEPVLLDEKSLLACLVRAIPSEASGRIKISTTLPNRLGKMLAPLHWHDYKKQYGRLDDFVSSHPELFVIDGDFVHLREGAHAIISATTTVAKVAAAAAAAPTIGAIWPPTVAVTPVAQSQVQRLRKVTAAGQTDGKQGPVLSHLQNINGQHDRLSTPIQSNGTGQLNQVAIAKSTLGDGSVCQNQARTVSLNVASKASGQRIMTVLGSRPDGLPYGMSNLNAVEFDKASSNGFGSSAAIPRKNGILYGNRQATRLNILGTESFSKQEFMGLSPTSENRMSRQT